MAWTAETGEYKTSRGDVFMVDPRALVIDWRKNLSRNGEEPPVNDDLIALARSMMPKATQQGSESGSSGQINAILTRPLPDRRLEVIGGFRRVRAALWLIESGECPDFRIKYTISRLNDAEAALANMDENLQRENPQPIQLAHAIRSLTEDYGMELGAVAARLKRSVGWCQALLDLLMLPKPIRDGVSNGHVPVSAAVELTKLPVEHQTAVFNEATEGGEKLTVARVKAKRREVQQETGNGRTVKRTIKDLHEFLLGRAGSKQHDNGFALASHLLDFIDGKIDDEKMYKLWDKELPLKKQETK